MREASAFLNQARLLPLDLAESHRGGSDLAVVLVHGLYATAGVFRPLRAALSRELGCSTHTFSYPPGPGVVELSSRLEEVIARLTDASRIVLVGHSLGGLVACHYVCQSGADPRVIKTATLAAPFRGSRRHFLVPGRAGRDVAIGAPGLLDLAAGKGRPRGVPHLSIVAGDDSMVEPGAYPAFGEQRLVAHVGHNGLLFHPDAIEAIVDWCELPRVDPPVDPEAPSNVRGEPDTR